MKNTWHFRKSSLAAWTVLLLLSTLLLTSDRLVAAGDLDLEELNESSNNSDSELENLTGEDDKAEVATPKKATVATQDEQAIDADLEGLISDKPSALVAEKNKEDLDVKGPSQSSPPQEIQSDVPKAVVSDRKREVAEAQMSVAKTRVTNLEFRMDGTTSRIILSLTGRPVYREVRERQVKQVVYFLDGTETPQKYQRAYDTTEFPSPVALFTLLQMPGQTTLSKLIVQLREDKEPSVSVTDTSLRIEFPSPDNKYEPKVVLDEDTGELATEENIYTNGKKYTGNNIKELEMKNIDVQDALKYVARNSGYSIVVGDDVTGKIGTLSLTNVPWDQAFALILQSKKLGYIRQGNVIRVGTLASLKVEKEEALANENSRIKVEPLRTVLIPMSYAKASEVAPKAKNFLTDRGSIDTDQRTNTVIVKDIERVVSRVQKLFAMLDSQPAHVSISAKFVEMQRKFSRSIGFQSFKFNETLAGINLDERASFSGGTGTSITTISSSRMANLEAILSLGESDNKVKVLANPSVSVVANQQATVNQSFTFFVEGIDFVSGVVTKSLRQITSNLALDVTPIVSGDGTIFMTVNLRNEIPSGPASNRTIDTRSVSTQVLVENGDTTVIGGVFNNTVTETKSGAPGLMNIPILGFFFSRSTFEDNRNEVFAFITAKIMNAEGAFRRNL